jgi:Domain of unknown function (DUF4276)
MHNISLFVEDRGHEVFLTALISRLAKYYRVTVKTEFSNARGGYGKAISKLKSYINDLLDDQEDVPDLLIVAIDGNCKGFSERKQEIESVTRGFSGQPIYAIPDPHIERWLLLDSAAFKKVLGKGCSAPTQKCERGLYKRLLREAVQKAGVIPFLDGIEYTEELVNAMNLEYLERTEESLGKLLKELRQKFQEWEQADHKGPRKVREDELSYDLLADNPPTSV